MRAAAVVVFVVLVAAVPAAGSALGTGGAAGGVVAEESAVTVAATIGPDGDARWEVSTAFALDSANETAAFRELAREFEAGESDVGFSAATFRALADRASERTGRPMAVESVSRTTAVSNETGVVSLRFTWTNFARTDGDLLRVNDAFPRQWNLAADQRLVVYPPPEHTASTVRPGPDRVQNGGLVWDGPQTFDGGPTIRYEPGANGGTTTTVTTTTAATTTAQPPDGDREDGFVLGALGVLVVVVGAAGVWAYLRQPEESDENDEATEAGEKPEAGPSPETGAAADSDGVAAEKQGPAEPVDPDLLSDEERVERLLERNDGRMRQADIVDATDWSNAKVSQLLSSMTEEGRVEKLRMGRENVISLPEDEGGER
jgi:hypothetical protein